MGHRVIIFAGAGASFGVSRQKYPMTRQFFEQLPDRVHQNPLFCYITAFIEQHTGKQTLDIEDVLWALGDLLNSIKSATEGGNILQHLLVTNQVQAVTHLQPSGAQVVDQLANLQVLAADLRDKIHDEVYKYYALPPDLSELEASWIPLFKWLRGLSPEVVDVVTTNYDLVIESALAEVKDLPIDTGKRATVDVRLDLSLWDRGRPSAGSGLLTKLHGSIDWRNAATGNGSPIIRWGHPEHDGKHDNRGIIYPGFKGVPEKEPFKSFHDYFGAASERATHLVFIGFAFRDDYINTLLQGALSPTARIAVIDPSQKLPALSFLSNAHHIQTGFGSTEPAIEVQSDLLPAWLGGLNEWMLLGQ